ncbi:hypothetical protein AX774_g6858 [Zancudomyces culisetae]|uniref:Uncharacterized protein n=1 Tax=Zancudomyces culisetae TaxID=1213189 RepID=A0A1R1PFE1_ZANCU|nr:hypothetical protein AX774_g6858 [Zancudomyces culisetae]|eukprot:OMH79720.1 hypothetical protein AX774_g6858 [Zancudomyces culisetae]
MVNLLVISAFLLASGLAAGATIPSIQVSNTNGSTENQANLYKRHDGGWGGGRGGSGGRGGGGPTMNIQMYMTSYYRDQINSVVIQPNCCYNLPNIDSSVLDGGSQGAGVITFCTGNNCGGNCVSSSRQNWLYPGNMQYDLGGRANSVYWSL